jgi:sulfate transport system ATP-binding protein
VRFIGNYVPVKNYNRFRNFEESGRDSAAILRPEFISIFKEGENVKYSESAEEGVVEDIIFRGTNLEIRVRLHENLLSATRSINDPYIRVGEIVKVFIHRLFVIDGEQVTMKYNQSLREESVII